MYKKKSRYIEVSEVSQENWVAVKQNFHMSLYLKCSIETKYFIRIIIFKETYSCVSPSA